MVEIGGGTLLGGDKTPVLLKNKSIGDYLELDEYNAIIYLLKRNTKFKENIDVRNNNITGKYGVYIFNLNSATITDKGILITKMTGNNLGSVKLLNPLFKNSKYTLHLKISHINDVNIGFGEVCNNIEYSEITVDLKNGEDVAIPVNNSNIDYIVDFKVVILIDHNVPEISQ